MWRAVDTARLASNSLLNFEQVLEKFIDCQDGSAHSKIIPRIRSFQTSSFKGITE